MEQLHSKAKVVYDEQTDEYLLHLDEEWCKENDWVVGDNINWEVINDSAVATNISAQQRKTELKYVLVETISMFRQRYVVLANSEEHARDEVTMMDHEFKEFSQLHLDEIISSTRVLTEDQVIELCDRDNDYLKNWTREKKLVNLVNKISYEV
ncbi:MAG: hypothetical protein EBU12_05190 [Microbacteriaceae bacterium]|nr:hypothetical protein [Microbacteriaceae bacterium]